MPDPQPVPPAVTGPAPETITQAELAEAFEHEIDGCYVGGREFAVNVFAYVRERRAPDLITEWPPVAAALTLPADEIAALKRSCRILANITARNHQVMEAARIEMRQNGPHAAMQWILNALPDVWDDDETAWDGKESAEEWFDRTESFYRAAQADAEPVVPPPPVAAALDRPTIDAEAPDARSPQAGSPGPVAAATAWAGGKSAEAWNAAAAAIPAEWVKAAENHYSMHGAGLLRNILAGVAPLIAAEAVSTERERTDNLKAELGEARSEAQMIRTHAHRVLVAVYGPDYVYRAPETFGNLLERWIWAVAAEVPEMAHASIADIERHCAERDGADHG